MSLTMSFCMSLAMMSINVGFVDNFFHIWARTWCIALVIAIPISQVVSPLIKKGLFKLAENGEIQQEEIATIDKS